MTLGMTQNSKIRKEIDARLDLAMVRSDGKPLSMLEISNQSGMTLSAVKQTYYRGLKKLRKNKDIADILDKLGKPQDI